MGSVGYLYSLYRHGLEVGLVLIQSCQAVGRDVWESLRALEVGFDIEMGIAVFLVQTAAFFHYLPDLGPASLGSFFVGSKGIDARYEAFGGMGSSTFGVEVIWKDREDLAGVLCGELAPELVDALLRRLLPDGQPLAWGWTWHLCIHTGRSGWGSCDVNEVVVSTLRIHGYS